MNQIRRRKKGNRPRRVIPMRRLHLASLDRRIQDVAVQAKADEGNGPYASRMIANVAHGLSHPARKLGLRMVESIEANVDPRIVRQFAVVLVEYADGLIAASCGYGHPNDVDDSLDARDVLIQRDMEQRLAA